MLMIIADNCPFVKMHQSTQSARGNARRSMVEWGDTRVTIQIEPPLVMQPDLIPLQDGTGAPVGGERADAAENRRRILDVAEQLFEAHGVEQVNMVDVAKAAKVGQGTLYRRFANKGALCLALMDAQMRDFQEHVFHTLRDPAQSGRDPLAQLSWFLDQLCHFQERHAPLLCAVDLRPGRDVTAWHWQYQTVFGLLNAARRARLISPDLDLPIVAETLHGALHPAIFLHLRRGRGHEPARIASGLNTLVEGLRQ
jgi:AcrR family transcriptional regulator